MNKNRSTIFLHLEGFLQLLTPLISLEVIKLCISDQFKYDIDDKELKLNENS